MSKYTDEQTAFAIKQFLSQIENTVPATHFLFEGGHVDCLHEHLQDLQKGQQLCEHKERQIETERRRAKMWQDKYNELSRDKTAPPELEDKTDAALGLKTISIRLPVHLIEIFKVLAEFEGIGCQPLMRTALSEYAATTMLNRLQQELLASKHEAKDEPR